MPLIPKWEQVNILEPQVTLTKWVKPEGNINSKFVIVNDYPSVNELIAKQSFTGYTGHLLGELLGNAGIMRKNCYITNVIKERPEEGISKVIRFKAVRGSKHKEAVIGKDWVKYKEEFKKELSLTKANVIVVVGELGLWTLTGRTGINNNRGSVLESTLLPGRKVIPIINPKGAIRMFIYQRYIHLDLFKVKSESEFPEIIRKKRTLDIFPSYAKAVTYLKGALEWRTPIACDIETSIATREVTHISFARNDAYALSIQFFKEGKNFYTIEEEGNLWFLIARILEDIKITKIFQNGSFDAWYLYRRYGIRVSPIWDTMIAMRIAFPDFKSGLDFLCSVYTDVPYYKDEGKNHKNISNEAEYARYSARDSVVLPEIMVQLKDDLEKQKNWESFLQKCCLIEPLIFMQEKGIKVDVEGIKNEKERTIIRLKELEEKFTEEIDMKEISLTSTKQLQTYFYIHLGIKPFTKMANKKDGTKHSVVTLDEKALQRIAVGTKTRKPRPEAFTVLEHRKLAKLNSTYYDISDIDPDSRMRCQYDPVGARTGRLSSRQNPFGTGMNMQNQPHSMKKFFQADPDCFLFEVDLAQAEWRVVAYLAMDYNMISVLESNGDIHRKTASFVFDCNEDEISDEEGSAPDFGNGEHSQRFWGKKSNHSMNYEISAGELALQLMIPLHQAKELIGKYLAGYSGIPMTFWNSIRRQIDKNRTITDLFGKSITYRGRIQDIYKSAFSYIPQSTVGTIINEWGIKRMYFDQTVFDNFDILLQVHDSIVFQVRHNQDWKTLAGQLKILKDSLEQPLEYRNQKFRIPCDFKYGFNWGEKKEINFDGTEADQMEKKWKTLIK
ncbi:MAG: hypothetical protein GY804_01025 [Alphaproteobacteria bacterium]|nr:hypothetical protein [Alphaproteobacteria bacterium]